MAVATAVKKPVLRRTVIAGLLGCLEYESGQSENASFGSALHAAIARYWQTCKAHDEESRMADLDTIAREVFFGTVWGIDPGRYQEFRDLLDLFARTHTAELISLKHLEHTLVVETDVAVLTGTADRIDRIDGGDPDDPPTILLIRDYKSQWAVEDHAFQLTFYAAAAAITWPSVRMVATEADHFRLQGKGIVRAEYERDYLLQWWEDMLVGVRDRLERLGAGRAAPTGGVGCQYCKKRLRCAAAIPPFDSAPENLDQAEEMFQTMLRYEIGLEESKSALKAYFKEREAEVWGGLEIGFLRPLDESWKAKKPLEIAKALTELGQDGKAALSVDASAVPSYLKGEMVRRGLAEYVLGAPTFKHRKAKKAKVVAQLGESA